jgi:hypothetical protein
MKQALSPIPNDIVEFIEQSEQIREQALAKFISGVEQIFEAMSLVPNHTFEPLLRSEIHWFPSDRPSIATLATHALDKKLWGGLVSRSKLGAYMNREQIEAIHDQIEKSPQPFNQANAVSTLKHLMDTRHQSLLKGVVDVFSRLSGNYRSHDAFKIGKKLVINHALRGYNPKSMRDLLLRYDYGGGSFNDLWRYLFLLEGRDPTAIDTSERPDFIIQDGLKRDESHFDFGTFRVRSFLNGNLHVFIEKPELIEKINQAIAAYYSGTLPAKGL